jgi:uncharacterized OsmC-like protein/fermentation-respiration switch protein FrsA (DUF1100 family)
MSSSTVRFPGTQGFGLAARFDEPAGRTRAVALFAHCFTCSKDTKAATYVSQALAARGIAVLRFDFTGLGASEGDFADTSFSSNVGDLLAAAKYLRENCQAPQILIGHSLGGAAALAAAAQIPELRAVATIGAPFDPAHVGHLVESGRAEIEAHGEAQVNIGGRPFRVKKQFLYDLMQHDAGRTIAGLRRALLVFHSPHDTIVGIDNAAKIFGAAKHPKSFVSLDDADHLLSRAEDASYAAEVLAAWASRYLDPATDAKADSVQGVRVVEAGKGAFAQDIFTGRHVLRADEPLAVGGNDSGPNPYDFLLAALGACTAMTVRLYAARKQWPLERVAVELKHDKIHASECADCETKVGRIDQIEREVILEGGLDEVQRERLMEIANKCPVHQTLHAEVRIPTRLKPRDPG